MKIENKLLLLSVLTSFAFWIPIFSLFMQSRSISEASTYLIISIYSFAVVILEYPTGVIGDYFSHKTSAKLGYIVVGIASIITLNNTTQIGYYLAFVCLMALGVTLISGSDAAYRFHLLGDNFKREYPRIKIAGTIATLLGILSGPLLYQFHPALPFVINGCCFLLAAVILNSLPEEERSAQDQGDQDNIFSLALMGLKSVLRNRFLSIIIAYSSVIATLSINMKWIYPLLFQRVNFPLAWWGGLIASFYLARIIGTLLYKRFRKKTTPHLLLLGILLLTIIGFGVVSQPVLLYLALFVEFMAVGYIETDIEIVLQESTDSKVRASVLSLTSLLGRLFSGLHIALLGFLGASGRISTFSLITALFVGLVGIIAIGVQITSRAKTKKVTQ